jgi:hypothetical protein
VENRNPRASDYERRTVSAKSSTQEIVVGAVDYSGSLCDLRDAKIDGEITTSTVSEIRLLIAQTEESAVRHKTLASFAWGIELDSPGDIQIDKLEYFDECQKLILPLVLGMGMGQQSTHLLTDV